MHDDFPTALEHHRHGRLDQAAQIYRAILTRNPQAVGALHLLGVVAYQQGQYQQASELIRRSIALQPEEASFYANLAEVYRAAGQFDQAISCCRTALALRPDSPEAANNLGLALLARGDAAAAVAQLEAALRSRPDDAMLHNNLGNALRLQGDTARALAAFRQAVRLNPDLGEAHSNLGQLLLERYQTEPALHHCREAVRLRPDLPEAHNNLGNVLRERGELSEARACYEQALRLNPELALTYNNVGQALQEEGSLREAVAWYHEALRRDPSSARVLCNLASAFEEQGDFDSAVGRYRVALQLDPHYAEAHNGLGFVLHEQGKFPEAVGEYREVLRLKPDFATGYCNLGHILEELGSFDEALTAFREALQRDPNHAGAYSLMATMLRGKLPGEDLEAMRRLLARPRLAPARRLALHFGVAHVLDARHAYAEAAEHLRQGNALCLELWQKQGQAYDRRVHRKMADDLIAAFTPEFFARVRDWGAASELPVFIVGLPRSGTTLTEQILASHSQVHGAGELNLARSIFEALPGLLLQSGPPAEVLAHLNREGADHLAQWHLGRLRELSGSALRVVDKMPDNYLFLGWLSALFPRARFIHCRRDLRDVAVSCWMTNFRHIRWAADPDDIAARFRDYQRLMDHWRAVLPGTLFEVDYEETVNDLEGVARRLVAWCGLEWEPACLAFHKTARPIRTASVAQVREPVHTRSVARWKHYEPALGALFAQLGASPEVGPRGQ
jgi:Flp pilus assembly protein TadD